MEREMILAVLHNKIKMASDEIQVVSTD